MKKLYLVLKSFVLSLFSRRLDFGFIHPPANIGNSNPTLDADTAYTSQFVSFPMGFFSMADNLDKAGYKVSIWNLGEEYFLKGNKDLEGLLTSYLCKYKPKIIGMDCHWMIHSFGAIRVSELIKKISPKTKIVLGGITASYFAEEILREYPTIDFVMRGQCDKSLVKMVSAVLKKNSGLAHIPNLVYRDKNGNILSNFTETPDVKNNLEITRYNLMLNKPMINSDRALIPMYRGCNYNCNYCTGGSVSFMRAMGSDSVCIIDPKTVVDIIRKNVREGKDKIYLYGDIRRGGKEYVDTFFNELESSGVSNVHIVFEFFRLANGEYLERWASWAKKHNVTLEATHSPESGNEIVRSQYPHKCYTNAQLLKHCQVVANYGIPQSVYFMLGLPKQNKEEVAETLSLAEKIVKIYVSAGFKRDSVRHDVVAYTFMQIPDAGSQLFHNPEKFGFKFTFRGFKGLVNMLGSARNWMEAVGYYTDNFSKDELIENYQMIQSRMRVLYEKYGLV